MTIETTYTQARANLAQVLDKVTLQREIVVIQRRHGEAAALIAADELNSLLETAHLLRSPANAERLLAALGRALNFEGAPLSMDALADEVGLDSRTP